MRPWTLALAPEEDPGTPLFARIAGAISQDIRRGRLTSGTALPGSRALAASLGVHRNTVLAAYQELLAEGWLTTEPTRGTFVSASIPDVKPRRFAPVARPSAQPGFDLPPLPAPSRPQIPPGVLSLAGGVPDVRLAPAAALARAYRRALRTAPRELLGYGDPQGLLRLRAALSAMLSATRGLAASPEGVLVTRGSQMAIDLVARTLLSPGDVVGVEELGYRPAWDALRATGAELVPIPVDASGLRVDRLADLARSRPVRAVYVTPHHQYPTTVALAPGRRLELLSLAARARFAIVEDDYDHEFHYEGRPLLPLASADASGVVLYVGTLSKVLAPGLRLGFLVAAPAIIARCTARRALTDRQGDLAMEFAVAELLEDGEVQRHIRRTRRTYAERRDALVSQLARAVGGALEITAPAGGTALWARAASGVDIDAWFERALRHGVTFQPASHFTFSPARRSPPFARIGFAQLSLAEMSEAVSRLARALR